MTELNRLDLDYLMQLLEILKQYKVKDYQTDKLHLTFDHAAFYNPPKPIDPNVMEKLYGETY